MYAYNKCNLVPLLLHGFVRYVQLFYVRVTKQLLLFIVYLFLSLPHFFIFFFMVYILLIDLLLLFFLPK